MLADVRFSDMVSMDQVLEFSGAVDYRRSSMCVSGTSCWRARRLQKVGDDVPNEGGSGAEQPLGIVASALNAGNSVMPFPIVDNSARASVRNVYLGSRWTMVDGRLSKFC